MIKIKIILFVLLIPRMVLGQNESFTFGFKENGVVFGNSKKANGIRLNLWDNNVFNINGFNLSIKSATKKTNGLSFGLLLNQDSISNGIKAAGVTNVATIINGFCISGLGNAAMDKMNGIGIGGFLNMSDTMNGVFVSAIGTLNFDSDFINILNGISVGLFNDVKNFNGIAMGFQNRLYTLNGISLGYVYNVSYKVNGIQLGIYNKTIDLYGVQFGLWNVTENKKYFKKTPLINLNFRKSPALNNK